MYQSFLPQSGISNKSIIHVVFITMCMNVAKESIFIYRWNIYFCYIFAHIFLDHVPHMTINNKILQFSAVVTCVNQYDEFLFFNCSKNSTHLKIMVPGLRGPAGGPCKSGDITGWGLRVLFPLLFTWTICSTKVELPVIWYTMMLFWCDCNEHDSTELLTLACRSRCSANFMVLMVIYNPIITFHQVSVLIWHTFFMANVTLGWSTTIMTVMILTS